MKKKVFQQIMAELSKKSFPHEYTCFDYERPHKECVSVVTLEDVYMILRELVK